MAAKETTRTKDRSTLLYITLLSMRLRMINISLHYRYSLADVSLLHYKIQYNETRYFGKLNNSDIVLLLA
jgi:hypothetical protein